MPLTTQIKQGQSPEESEWEKVEANPTWNFKEDRELVGYFINGESNVGPNESNLWTFRKEDGSIISVWGNTILDMRFKNLVEGDKVRIIYKGWAKSPKTGRTYHNFEVFKSKKKLVETEEEIPIVEEN